MGQLGTGVAGGDQPARRDESAAGPVSVCDRHKAEDQGRLHQGQRTTAARQQTHQVPVGTAAARQ